MAQRLLLLAAVALLLLQAATVAVKSVLLKLIKRHNAAICDAERGVYGSDIGVFMPASSLQLIICKLLNLKDK